MAAGDVKIAYAASTTFTLTNLHSLAASQAHLAGWESNVVDNTTNLYQDYLISGLVKTAAADNQAGTVEVHVVAMISDTVWPDVFDGTESAATVSSASRKAQICKIGANIDVTADASTSYEFGPFTVASLFGGVCPPKFVVFITGDAATTTAAQFAADTNIVTYKGIYYTAAQS